MALERRKLGSTGKEVTLIGLGGEGVLRTFGHERDAVELINHAIDLGINYFESARAYSGSEQYYGKALQDRRKEIFLASKSHARDKRGALIHLAETLANMNTDYLDLWQVHDVRTQDDVATIFGPGGSIEAFDEARMRGLVRFIGVTGHHDPTILKKCLELFDFDTVLIPVNMAEPSYNSFIQEVIPAALSKGMGIVGMKVYLRGMATQLPWYESVKPFLYFALSQPISTVVIGCDNLRQLEENVALASMFHPMTAEESKSLINKVSPFARSLMYYKP
ncbi:MAG: aldo/keto reductase [Desulfomonile sp.]|jgi:aryl-alcohol dehydrogenase-like predicted oxidoreductase